MALVMVRLLPNGGSWKNIFRDDISRHLDNRVHFVGTLPHDVLTQLLQVSAVHVYLTYPFVLSWSMLEAMSMGALVVGSRTAPVQEVIDHGRNGLLTDFFDADALADTVAEALERGPAARAAEACSSADCPGPIRPSTALHACAVAIHHR